MKVQKLDILLATQSLLHKAEIGTQEEIAVHLKKAGFDVSQAKISRILRKLNVIKINENGRTLYRLPTDMIKIASLGSAKHLILAMDHNESLIVITTKPGSAQLVGSVLDHIPDLGILGTVAGDDTLFVAPKKISQIAKVLNKISENLLK